MVPRISAISYPDMNPPVPDTQSEKQEYVRSLFDRIAYRYDFLNHFLSCGFDIIWRRQSIRLLADRSPKAVLDLATGTGDLAITAATILNATVTGLDISTEMLKIAEEKVRRRGLHHRITFKRGRAEQLDYDAQSFDAVTVAFGVRNFANVQQGLREMCRVLRPGGVAMVLEFSKPRVFLFRSVYGFYFRHILPFLAGVISKSRASYEYLPASVQQFPDGNDFLALLSSAGFARTESYPLTLGIATIYLGFKDSSPTTT